MAYQLNYQAESFLSADDLSTAGSQIFAYLDSSAFPHVHICDASVKGFYRAEGVYENTPLANMPATISYLGVTKLTVDAAYNVGTYLKPGANGYGTTVLAADATNYARAIALQDSTASGDIIAVRLIDTIK